MNEWHVHLNCMKLWAGFPWRVLASKQSFLIYMSTSIWNRKKLKTISPRFFSIFHKPMFKMQHILWSTHMANFNILILPSNQSSENILFLVYRWCCNRKREQLPVGGELLQATCSLKYQPLEWLISSIHHGFTHFQISSMSFYRYDEYLLYFTR